MARMNHKKTQLLLGCGCAAITLSMAGASQRAEAQGIQATPQVTQGSAFVDRSVPGQDTISVDTTTVVIDWSPDEDALGDALDFLPTGNTATFQNGASFPGTDFSVLNRILPSTNGNIAVIDGTVISQLIDPQTGAATPGGFVAFYSPTGLFIGSNAVFDVGSLMLTTLDPDPNAFGAFAAGGSPLALNGQTGTTAPIIVDFGAQIDATPQNSFFVAAAAEVQMRGTARINGSHAYVAGEAANLTFNNGLFDIQVPVGTLAAQAIDLSGNIGGPSSTGAAGDNHMIYAVARAQTDPISMFFRGNLGFDPAANASIVNGEIILSANYDVSGRTVNGGTVSQGINGVFDANSRTSDVQADISLRNFDSTSSILAIGTHNTIASLVDTNSTVDGDLVLVGRQSAQLISDDFSTVNITGDVLVSSRGFGAIGTSFNDPAAINAQGGQARILATNFGSLSIGGEAFVTAQAFGGADTGTLEAGTASGGIAVIESIGQGLVDIAGRVQVRADARGAPLLPGLLTGATSTGGFAQIVASTDGSILMGLRTEISANAFGKSVSSANPSIGSDAIGGLAQLVSNGGGAITIGDFATLGANATAGSSNEAGQAALAQGGDVIVSVDGASNIDVAFDIAVAASATGGANFGSGQGGEGLGGSALASVSNNGTLTLGGGLQARADGSGGNGTSGGDGFGGIAGAFVDTGLIDIQTFALADANGEGGNADFGFGGRGGDGVGGLALLEATGSLIQTATFNIGGAASVNAEGEGGLGGRGDGSAITAGNGGDGFGGNFATANQAVPDFSDGAYILAGGDNGFITIGSNASASVAAVGGDGGDGGFAQGGGDGGNATGGTAEIGSALLNGDGSVGAGIVTVGNASINAAGFGGFGGAGGTTTDPLGNGGIGNGGEARLIAAAGDLNAGAVELLANGTGGDGENGGNGTGGTASLIANSAQINLQGGNRIIADANGGAGGTGGNANSGFASVDLTGSAVSILPNAGPGSLLVRTQANGGDGSSQVGDAGSGTAELRMLDSSINGDILTLQADAFSVPSASGINAGLARGGTALANIDGNASVDVAVFDFLASAFTEIGGTAEGGLASLALGTSGTPLVTVTDLTMAANASGGAAGDPTDNAGRFEVLVDAGSLNAQNFNASATGDFTDAQQQPSSIAATDGDFLISASGVIDVIGDLVISAGTGHFVGDTAPTPSNDISVTSQGTIEIIGDDDNAVDFSALTMALSASEIDITAGARIAAGTMTITSLDIDSTAIIGGASEEAGFTLTQDEAARINAGDFTFEGPEIVSNGPSEPDIVLRDLTIFGSNSTGGGTSRYTIQAGFNTGIIRVEGMVDYVDAAIDDSFQIRTGDRIEVVTPGGIRIVDSDGLPSGNLILDAFDIWAADADMIGMLQDNSQFAGRDEDLALAAAGSDDPQGYLIGGSVQLGVSGSLLVRNTGSASEPGGVTVGDGGLEIFTPEPLEPLDVFAYGRRDNGDGTFVTGEAFFDEVNFNLTGTGATNYTDIAAFNDCIINTGECPGGETPETEIEIPVNNRIVTLAPPNEPAAIIATRGESNRAFGIEFPGLIETPLLSEEPPLEDPVASGGDTTLYGQSGQAGEQKDEQ